MADHNQPSFGRLETVPLRDAWKREDTDFTPWLAEDDNLELLAETLGLSLQLEGIEQNVGPFRADILCRDVETDSLVLIENQLERSDHTHLGQLITYTAGLETAVIVWITSEFADEHRAALDWLNNATDEEFKFFGLEIRVQRIGESAMAPSFRVIAMPNNWSKRAHRAARDVRGGEFSELGQQRRAYWVGFREFLSQRGSPLHFPRAQAGSNIFFPVKGTPFTISGYRSKNGPGAYVRIKADDPYHWRDALQPLRERLEEISGRKFIGPEDDPTRWDWFLKGKACEGDPNDESDWSRQFDWLAKNLESLQAALEFVRDQLDENGELKS